MNRSQTRIWFTRFLILLFCMQTSVFAGGGAERKKEAGSSWHPATLQEKQNQPQLTGVLQFDKKLLSQNKLPLTPPTEPAIAFSDDELILLAIVGVAVATFAVTYFIKGDFVEALKTFGGIAASAALLIVAAGCCLAG